MSPEEQKTIELLKHVFDAEFYLEQAQDDEAAARDPFAHFMNGGWLKGLDPHPLFSVSYYLEQREDVRIAGYNPLEHYLKFGFREQTRPHFLFDPLYYFAQAMPAGGFSLETNPLLHYLNGGYRRYSPYPLFDQEYYLEMLQRVRLHERILHKQFEEKEEEAIESILPLVHFLKTGHKKKVDPHPLFSVAAYYRQKPALVDSDIDPLTHYLRWGHNEGVYPHPLFDRAFYLAGASAPEKGTSPLVHFLNGGYRNRSSHVLFDVEHYLAQAPDARENLDWLPPVVHYLKTGWKRGISPHPLFDSNFYLKNNPGVRDYPADPLSHYLEFGWRVNYQPHPLFDNNWYLNAYPGAKEQKIAPLKHYAEHSGRDPKFNPCYGLRTKEYLASIPASPGDKRVWAPDHFYRNFYGYTNVAPEAEYPPPPDPGEEFQALNRTLNDSVGLKRNVFPFRAILTSHDASRTGAPLIILRVAQMLNDYGIECFLFLKRGGELLPDFYRVATVIECEHLRFAEKIHNFALHALAINRPGRTFALCNSAETADLVRLFSSLGIPTFSLVHEFASVYGEGVEHVVGSIVEASRKVVVPSQLVLQDMLSRLNGTVNRATENVTVIPTGMLNKDLLNDAREDSRQLVLEELHLPPETFIVLGSGSMNERKGLDFFVTSAKLFRKRWPQAKAAFVWLGCGTDQVKSSYEYWLEMDVHNAGLDEFVYFIGARNDTKPYFQAADAFLMLSRLDPFPCVVLEAMAAETPVVLFDSVIGAAEAVRSDAGFVVPFLDLPAVVDKLSLLYEQPEVGRNLGRTGKQRVMQEYDVGKFVDKLLYLISSSLKVRQLGSYINPLVGAEKQNRLHPPVYFVTPNWSLSGVNSIMETLVSGLCEKGWDASLLFTEIDPLHYSGLPQCPYKQLPLHGSIRLKNRWEELKCWLQQHAPCVAVLGFDHLLNSVSSALPDDIGVVGLLQSDETEYYETVYRLGRYWNRVVATSKHIGEKTLSLNPSLQAHLRVIANSTVSASEITAPWAHRQPDAKLRLMYSGRLVQKQKRVLDFIDITRKLKDIGLPYELTLVGDDSGSGTAAVLGKEWKKEIEKGTIKLVGRLSPAAVKHQLKLHDVFMLISEYEGLSLSLVEAMACGCVPVVCDMKSGVNEVVEHGKNGFVVHDRNWDELVQYLVQLHQNRDLRDRLAEEGQRTVCSRFTEEQMVEAYDEVLREVWEEVVAGAFERPQTFNWASTYQDITLPQCYLDLKEHER